MEELMYYVWQQKLWGAISLVSKAHEFELLDMGSRNLDAGPDFFNAKIKLDGMVWAGNVEMHVKASDWYRHHHEQDAAYNNVILHVVLVSDAEITLPNGEVLLQAQMTIPEALVTKYRRLRQDGNMHFLSMACADRVATVPSLIINDWLTSLAVERMTEKTARVRDLIYNNHESWQEAFYVILSRSFGTGINSDAFERVARSLPYMFIKKHADNLLQVEALLLGQGGFLTHVEVPHVAYLQDLCREYAFLKAKFELKPLPLSTWKMSKLRPSAFPPIRLAMLARLLVKYDDLFSHVVDLKTIDDFQTLFAVQADGYWSKHFVLSDVESPYLIKGLGRNTIQSLIINAVVPILVAYGQWRADEDAVEQALLLLEALPAEKNRYISMWSEVGIRPKNAFETQALLQLFKAYCQPRKCLRCRVGCWLMKK